MAINESWLKKKGEGFIYIEKKIGLWWVGKHLFNMLLLSTNFYHKNNLLSYNCLSSRCGLFTENSLGFLKYCFYICVLINDAVDSSSFISSLITFAYLASHLISLISSDNLSKDCSRYNW